MTTSSLQLLACQVISGYVALHCCKGGKVALTATIIKASSRFQLFFLLTHLAILCSRALKPKAYWSKRS